MSISTRVARALATTGALLLVAALLSSTNLFGQQEDPVGGTAQPEPVRLGAEVLVLGDGFLSAPDVAPIEPGDCLRSAAGPIERAAASLTDTIITVENRACFGANLASVASDQLGEIDDDHDLIVVGGTSLEFDWAAVAAACLEPTTRSADGCLSETNLARATASNSFFSWRSVLQQIHRDAPAATIVLVAPPIPVTTDPLPLGSTCCGDTVDGREAVRGVFEVAGSIRRAVVETTPDVPTLIIETDVAFDGHRLGDAEPWLTTTGPTMGLATADGAQALGALLDVLMPIGDVIVETPPSPAEYVIVVGETDADATLHAQLASASSSWFERLDDAGLVPTVAVVAAERTDPPPPTTTIPADEPPADEPPVDEPPVDEPPVDEPPVDEPPVDEPPVDEPPADEPPADEPPADDVVAFVPEGLELQVETDNEDPGTLDDEDPDTVDVADPEPELPEVVDVATSAEQFADIVTPRDVAAGTTTLGSLASGIDRASALLSGASAEQHVVVFAAGAFDLPPLHDEEPGYVALLAAIDATPATVHVVAPDPQSAAIASEVLSGSPATVALLDAPEELGSTLPAPAPIEILRDVAIASSTEFLRGPDADLLAAITVAAPVDVTVTWYLDDENFATGQRARITTSQLSLGTHELEVLVSTDREVLGASTFITITDDGDGLDIEDGCPQIFNPLSTDLDDDAVPDACDPDDDNDGLADTLDPCPASVTTDLADFDLDRVPDHCDADPTDGPLADADGDGYPDVIDNCPTTAQTNQFDHDDDGVGNACEGTSGTIGAICTIFGTTGNDTLRGTDGPDVICGLAGNDIIYGEGGDDVIFAGTGNDIVNGGLGSDRIYGGTGTDTINGGGWDDVLIGGAGADQITGGFGADIVSGGSGSDTLHGDTGADIVLGGQHRDTMRGGDGADVLSGGLGNDDMLGQLGADILRGDAGADYVGGGNGDDVLVDVEANDTVRGGGGTDLIGDQQIRVT